MLTVLTQNSLAANASRVCRRRYHVMFIDENGGRGRHVPIGGIEMLCVVGGLLGLRLTMS